MKNDVAILYDVLLDNQDKSNEELIIALEKAIAKIQPYNHNEGNIQTACNIPKRDKDTSALKNKDIDKFSKEIEILEDIFTKREAVYMLAGIQKQMGEFEKLGKLLSKLKGVIDEE